MNLKNIIFLTQSDTTAGFLSANPLQILKAKNSPKDKAMLRESCDLEHIKDLSRLPKILQKAIRRTKKTTFVFDNNLSFRVINDSNSDFSNAKDSLHRGFLKQFGVLFSSSANKKGEKFKLDFAQKNADIIVRDVRGIYEDLPSHIFKVKKSKIKKLR